MTHMTHDPRPMVITPTRGTRRGRGIVVLDNPLDLESKKSQLKLDGQGKPDVRPLVAAIPSAKSI